MLPFEAGLGHGARLCRVEVRLRVTSKVRVRVRVQVWA